MHHFLKTHHKEILIMAHAISSVIKSNSTEIYRGLPLGPSSLAYSISSLIKTTISLSNHDSHHPTTIELNSAFLELVSQQQAMDIASLLKEWATYFNSSQWGETRLDPYDEGMVLDALVGYIKDGLSELVRMHEQSCISGEQREVFSKSVDRVLRLVQGMRNRASRTLIESRLGRRMTDEEELVWLIEHRI
jgi:hypothetical protein